MQGSLGALEHIPKIKGYCITLENAKCFENLSVLNSKLVRERKRRKNIFPGIELSGCIQYLGRGTKELGYIFPVLESFRQSLKDVRKVQNIYS